MFRLVQSAVFAALFLVSTEALAWPTTAIAGTGVATEQVQGYAWKDLGGGAWQKWNSVAYRDLLNNDLKVARRSASSANPSWSAWTVETVDNSANNVGTGVSLAIDQNGVEYISYLDATNQNLKFAKRVGNGAGNCFAGSDWDCSTIASSQVWGGTTIGLTFDQATQQYTVHIVFSRLDNGDVNLWYARKIGAAAWSNAWIRTANGIILSPDAIAFSGASPLVAYGEVGVGLQLSKFQGPAQGNWTTTTIDPAGASHASMDARSFTQNIAYLSGSTLKFASRNFITGGFALSTVDTSASHVSMVIDDEFVPHIAYKKGNMAKRAKRPGSTWLTETADSTANTGGFASIQVDTQPAADKVIITHGDGFGTIRVSEE